MSDSILNLGQRVEVAGRTYHVQELDVDAIVRNGQAIRELLVKIAQRVRERFPDVDLGKLGEEGQPGAADLVLQLIVSDAGLLLGTFGEVVPDIMRNAVLNVVPDGVSEAADEADLRKLPASSYLAILRHAIEAQRPAIDAFFGLGAAVRTIVAGNGTQPATPSSPKPKPSRGSSGAASARSGK